MVFAGVPTLHQGLMTVAERSPGEELAVELLEDLEAGIGRGPWCGLGLFLLLAFGRRRGGGLLLVLVLLLLGLGLLLTWRGSFGFRFVFVLALVFLSLWLCHRDDLARTALET